MGTRVGTDEDFPIRENVAKRQKGNGVAVTPSVRRRAMHAPTGDALFYTYRRDSPGSLSALKNDRFVQNVGANCVRPRARNARPYVL